jgi:hypothetical protein
VKRQIQDVAAQQMKHQKQQLTLSNQQPHSSSTTMQTGQVLKPLASHIVVQQLYSNLLAVIISRTAPLSTSTCSQSQTMVELVKLVKMVK